MSSTDEIITFAFSGIDIGFFILSISMLKLAV